MRESSCFRLAFAVAAIGLSVLSPRALAEPTHVMVRAQSLDAKFIGAHTGGVAVTLTDAKTGAVLAKGTITGGTGDTAAIMQTPRKRGDRVAEGDAAGFEAVLDLSRPTLVRAEAVGPLGRPAASISVSSTMWIIPGRDVSGDGWVLTFPGLAIEPTTGRNADGSLSVAASVTMLCGCPITPGGIWDANDYNVMATVLDHDVVVASSALVYAGRPSEFSTVLPKLKPGRYVLRIVATSTKTPNAGVVETSLEP